MTATAGLDFGTSNSALSVRSGGTTRVIRINNRESSEKTLRSVIHFDEDKSIEVGQRAVDRYVESHGMYGRFLQSIKTFLSQPSFTDTLIFGTRYSIEDLVTIILKEIKRIGEERSGVVLTDVTLGRPVEFSEDADKDALAERRLRKAAKQAGFGSISFELEPIAATLAYRATLAANEEKTVLMGDFGGGTSDFCVMRLRGGTMTAQQKRESVLAVGGVYIGGDTFDGRIMWSKVTPTFGRDTTYRGMTGDSLPIPAHMVRSLCSWHQIPFLRERKTLQAIRDVRRTSSNPALIDNLENLILENKGFMIFQAIERAKKELTTENETAIQYTDRTLTINEPVSRTEFEDMISQDLRSIATCVDGTLTKASLTADKIDVVLLTGGSSFIPAVQRLFAERFGDNRVVQLDAFTSVAHGLGLSTE